MSSLHDNKALDGHNRSVLSPNGGTVDFGSALSKSVFQQHKQNSKQQHNNQQPVNGGDFNQSCSCWAKNNFFKKIIYLVFTKKSLFFQFSQNKSAGSLQKHPHLSTTTF